MSSIYDFTVNGADHKPYDLQQHKGHPLLIVNVASQCGYTKSGYETATALYSKFKDQGFTVLAFPCNQFGAQEPGTEQEIQQTTCTRFKAEFPLLEKVKVNGADAHPLWAYLQHTKTGIFGSAAIKWNFTFFLVNGEGVPVARFSPGTSAETMEKSLLPLLSNPKM
ncbi:glutathione peroxidase-type tryparedoxin peroxidase [Strigomonas culicis]|uniref:Glutathione peroxidase n=1 Tax=Strigomonas culicis TaxID=28005 RepID=S9UXY2_9TRYP|nr:glutathione peroxidase-type tryparedoxin peroxidase [Strigomonas culicis]|eukprot:EPY35717.1 glutathione peroxidase-type tryparedoxin peroxidase [Strigomonas culicis]